MGTRADFYVGKDKDELQYLGSIAWDGYPDGVIPDIWAENEKSYVANVERWLHGREDASIPERDGWPWPWDDSGTSDYAYSFFDGKIWATHGDYWQTCDQSGGWIGKPGNRARFPDMAKFKKVTFGKRSGLIVFGV